MEERSVIKARARSRSLLHALFKWDQQQKPEFEVGLLRRKTAALLTTPPPAKIPLPPKPSSPIFNHPLSNTFSLSGSLFIPSSSLNVSAPSARRFSSLHFSLSKRLSFLLFELYLVVFLPSFFFLQVQRRSTESLVSVNVSVCRVQRGENL